MTQPTAAITRGPILHDLITVTPLGVRLFEVLALDDLYGEFVYAAPVDGQGPAQWYSLTYVKLVEPQGGTPMTREDLTAWLRIRCVPEDLDFFVGEFTGKTENEVEAAHRALHGES